MTCPQADMLRPRQTSWQHRQTSHDAPHIIILKTGWILWDITSLSRTSICSSVEAFFSASMSSLTPAEELMVESVAKQRGAGSSGAASKFVVSQ